MPISVVVEPSGLIVAKLSGVLAREEVDASKREVFGHLMMRGSAPMLMHVNDPKSGSYPAPCSPSGGLNEPNVGTIRSLT